MILEKECIQCGGVFKLKVKAADVKKHEAGALIQDAFPYLNPSERELFLTGWCKDC